MTGILFYIRTLLMMVILCIGATINTAHATPQQNFDYTHIAAIPVLYHGRIQPLDTFARTHANLLLGNETINGKPAIAWLSEILFSPSRAIEKPIISIKNKALKTRLALPENQDYFTLENVQTALAPYKDTLENLAQTPSQNLESAQKDLLALQKKSAIAADLLRSFSMLLPLNLDVPNEYKENITAPITFLKARPYQQSITEALNAIVKEKGESFKNYSAEEQKIASLAFMLFSFEQGGQENTLLNIIPDFDDQHNETTDAFLFTPWSMFIKQDLTETNIFINLFADLIQSYQNNAPQKWLETSQKIKQKSVKIIEQNTAKNLSYKFKVEQAYKRLSPYKMALILYISSLILLGIYIKISADIKNNILGKVLHISLYMTYIAAILVTATAIITRSYILSRPPVGTLYESILFVALICAITGFIIWLKSRNIVVIFIGGLSALTLLIIAPYILEGQQNLQMLSAVLNTNFWLATHVLCITAGYGVCIMAALLAHAYLLNKSLGKNTVNADGNLFALIHKLSLLALLLTAVGTALGGIWADQSWGRFWGWDPKENGALLIVLWLIWAQHGRLSGHLKPLAFSGAIAATNIIVALSWFGVNLLNTGLHTYGFIAGLGDSLFAFIALETIFIIATSYFAQKRTTFKL